MKHFVRYSLKNLKGEHDVIEISKEDFSSEERKSRHNTITLEDWKNFIRYLNRKNVKIDWRHAS